jgi:hypothetical protein
MLNAMSRKISGKASSGKFRKADLSLRSGVGVAHEVGSFKFYQRPFVFGIISYRVVLMIL